MTDSITIHNATDRIIGETNFEGISRVELSCMNGRGLTGAGLLELAKWPIRELIFSMPEAVDDDLSGIAAMQHLSFLRVHCGMVGDGGIAYIASLKSLKTLELYWSYDLSDGACRLLASMNLENLTLEGSEDISDRGAEFLAGSRTIRILWLPTLSKISDDGLRALAQGDAPLEEIGFGHLRRLTDAGLMHLAKKRSLKKVRTLSNFLVTPSGVAALQAAAPHLTIEAKYIEPPTPN